MDCFDAAVLQLLRKLAVPVNVGEALGAAIGLADGLDLDAEVVVSYHGLLLE